MCIRDSARRAQNLNITEQHLLHFFCPLCFVDLCAFTLGEAGLKRALKCTSTLILISDRRDSYLRSLTAAIRDQMGVQITRTSLIRIYNDFRQMFFRQKLVKMINKIQTCI